MPDTKIRLPGVTSGWTVYTRLKTEAGLIWQTTTSTYVAYVVASVANYALAMPETPAGSGDYESTMPAGSAAGNYTWAHYRQVGGAPAIGDPYLGGGGGSWDGTGFSTGGGGSVDLTPLQTAIDGVAADVATIAAGAGNDLATEIIIDDATPQANTFVIAMADASDVPETFVWRGSLARFDEASATLPNGKFPIHTYTRLTSKTARLTFSPALPVAPVDGETIQVY